MDNNSNNGLSCVMGCWLAALAAGILLAALLMVIGGFAFTPAAFFGLLAFVLLGALLSYAICGGNNAKHGAGVAAAGAAGAAAVATGASASKSASSAGSAAASAGGDAVATGATASGAAVAAATTAASDTTAAGFAGVKGDTTLSGEDELAGRKGEWKYDGEAAKPKAAKKPAAKKPAAKKAAAKPAKAAAAKPAKAAAKPAKKTAAKKEAKPVAKDGKPELLKKARAGGPDDLKQIKGVGPKMEGMLHTMGVFHFDQVASWRKAEVQWVDDNLDGFKGRVSRDEWVKQAKVLAKGGTTEFSKKVDKGGVY